VWNEENSVVRWMCSFDTSQEDIREFVRFVGEVLSG
jgi:threonine aldolase